MRACILRKPGPLNGRPLAIEEVAVPVAGPGEALLKVLACGVCRTDLHITMGELPQRLNPLTLGHQIVGEVVTSPSADFPPGSRVGVSWVGGTDGTCPFCRSDRENLCDNPIFTGYTRNGGYAEYATARADFMLPIPEKLSDTDAAPLLCAGIIGFRSLRVAEVKRGQRVGLFGFGSSGQLALRVLHAWDCKVNVSTRGENHRELARKLGAEWVGGETDAPPERLDAAITFAPSGDVVIAALRSLAKGGIVAINAIHLDRIPQFDYDSLLWEERSLRSVANMTRQDGLDFLKIAAEIGITPSVQTFPLEQANEALGAIYDEKAESSVVLLPQA
jgi:propanol-preferring alcohol dehydrogenase